MSFLHKAKDRAREKAAEVAREAADAPSRAVGAVAAKVQDPATHAKVKGGLSSAGRTAADASARAADASVKAASAVAAKAQDPATHAKVKKGLTSAGRGARTMVERIDPGILADVVIKATALQERANARLRQKGSVYRIGEIQVTASLPPGISFSIERLADAHHDRDGRPLFSSTDLLAHGRAAEPESIVSLDTHEQSAIVAGLSAAGSSMDAAVEALEGEAPDETADADHEVMAPDGELAG